jgi:hypothetical protein
MYTKTNGRVAETTHGEPKAATRKRGVCPSCKERALVPILYGVLPDSLAEDRERGDVIWGGFALPRGSPRWKCGACNGSFRTSELK